MRLHDRCTASLKNQLAAAGKVMRVGTLGVESEAEQKLRRVQETCLAKTFHISMDRVNYKASNPETSLLEEEQKDVLQEIKELENPEVSPLCCASA